VGQTRIRRIIAARRIRPPSRRILALLALLATSAEAGGEALGMPAPASIAPATAKTICARPQVRLLAHMGVARVVEAYSAVGNLDYQEVWACWGAHHVGLALGSDYLTSNSVAYVRPVALAGYLAAYDKNVAQGQRPEPEDHVFVVNLRTRKVLRSALDAVFPARPPQQPKTLFASIGPVTALVLRADGAAAWIAEAPGGFEEPPQDFQVVALDASGPRLLADGLNIVRNSLHLSGSTVSWEQGGREMSAPLQ